MTTKNYTFKICRRCSRRPAPVAFMWIDGTRHTIRLVHKYGLFGGSIGWQATAEVNGKVYSVREETQKSAVSAICRQIAA